MVFPGTHLNINYALPRFSFLYSRYYAMGIERKRFLLLVSLNQLHIQQGILKGLCLKARGFHSINKKGIKHPAMAIEITGKLLFHSRGY